MQSFFMRTTRILIRPRECVGIFQSSLGAMSECASLFEPSLGAISECSGLFESSLGAMSECTFSHVAAHIFSIKASNSLLKCRFKIITKQTHNLRKGVRLSLKQNTFSPKEK